MGARRQDPWIQGEPAGRKPLATGVRKPPSGRQESPLRTLRSSFWTLKRSFRT
jgi:hypothetical protein